MEMDTDPLEGSSYDLGVTVKAEIKEEDEDDHYNTIRKISRVSWHQLEILCEFFKSNRAIAIAHNRALQDKEYSQRKWKEISETLNSQSDGAYKDWTSWKKYWVDYKAKLKKRVTALRASHVGTGGGPPIEKSLTEMEEKFLRILGKEFGQGMAGARVEPPSEIVAAALHEGVQDSQAPEPIPRNIQPVLDPPFSTAILPAQPILEPLPQSPLEPMVQDLPARSPSRTPPSSPLPAASTPAGSPYPAPAGSPRPAPAGSPRPAPADSPRPAPADSSRRRGRRRESSMSQAAARRALVRSSQMHADAAVRTAEAMEKTVLILGEFRKTAMRIERALLELAQCVQTNQEPIEFNSTDAMMDPKTGLMICLHCLEDFDSSLLSDHMIHSHNYRRVLFKCHICQNTFQERKLLMIHRQECQPEQKVRKRKTFQQIMREVEAKYFMEDQEDLLEPAACPICLLELPKYCLKEHLLNEHRKPDVILTCGRCNRNFKSKLTLREHVKLVHEAIEDSEECELCGQKFRSLKYLSNHKRNVHPSGNKIHKCAVCGKEFKSRLCLHQHSKYVHPPESASVECPHCPNKMFKSRINLTQHLKVAHGWKRK